MRAGNMVDPLTKLAITYGTDKFGYHDYTPNYFALFKHLKDAPIRLLEIGVGGYQDADRGGESLEVWRDFFPNAQIYGIDLQKKEMDLGARVRILQGSQVDADFLQDLVRNHGPFDIIIDDGSHRNEHVVESFDRLFPTLKDGGIYVVEDVQTAFFPRFGGSLEMTAPNSVGYFAGLFQSGRKALGIKVMERFHNMVALHKEGGARTRSALSSIPVEISRVLRIAGAKLPEGFESAEVMTSETRGKALIKQMKDEGPFDLVIDGGNAAGSKLAKTFETLFPLLEDGAQYMIAGSAGDYFKDLFVAVDHREIAVNFPEAKLNPLASSVYAMACNEGFVLMHKAPNDYPSNFAFEFNHPQAMPAFDAMEEILLQQGKERGLLLFADIMTRAGDEDRAGRMLQKLDKQSATSRVYFNMAVRRRKLDDDWDGAMSLLKQAVQLYPDDYRIRSQLGGVFAKEKTWDRAVEEFEKGIELAPRDPLLRIQHANALGQQGRHLDAVAAATVAVELAPANAGHHVQLGRLLVNAGEFEAAVLILQKAVKLNGDVPNAYRQLSRALYELDRNSEALETVEKALKLRPDNREYQRWQERLVAV